MCAQGKLSRGVDAIASSVVQHLAGLLDAKVTITKEIEAEIPTGAPDNVVRTVTENGQTLKFESSGFEEADDGGNGGNPFQACGSSVAGGGGAWGRRLR